MQCYRQLNFFRRCVEYAAKVYDAGAARGDGSGYGIQPVYFVALMNTGVPKFDRSDAGIWRDRFHEVVDETIFLNYSYGFSKGFVWNYI